MWTTPWLVLDQVSLLSGVRGGVGGGGYLFWIAAQFSRKSPSEEGAHSCLETSWEKKVKPNRRLKKNFLFLSRLNCLLSWSKNLIDQEEFCQGLNLVLTLSLGRASCDQRGRFGRRRLRRGWDRGFLLAMLSGRSRYLRIRRRADRRWLSGGDTLLSRERQGHGVTSNRFRNLLKLLSGEAVHQDNGEWDVFVQWQVEVNGEFIFIRRNDQKHHSTQFLLTHVLKQVILAQHLLVTVQDEQCAELSASVDLSVGRQRLHERCTLLARLEAMGQVQLLKGEFVVGWILLKLRRKHHRQT